MSLSAYQSTADTRPPIRRAVGPPPLVVRIASVLAVPLLLYTLFVTGEKAVTNHQLEMQQDALRVQVQQQMAENQQLLQQIEQARSDAAVEKIAREQLGLVNPGDHVLIVPAGNQPAAPQDAPSPSRPPEIPPGQAWWNYFFGS